MADYTATALVRRYGHKQISVQLSDKVCALLEVIETCQALQRGEIRQPPGDGLLAARADTIQGMKPADLEMCLTAAVGVVIACRWADDIEHMALTADEGNVVRDYRARKGVDKLAVARVE